MRLQSFHAAALAASLATTASLADARPLVPAHGIAAHHRHRHTVAFHRRAAPSPAPYGYTDAAPEDPRYGYAEAPYDPNYNGPGAEVFAATKAQARDSGLLHELAPDAKVSATGIVVGGGL